MPISKLVKNSIVCRICKQEIVSKHRHDFVTCRCGAVSIDGGNDYRRIIGGLENIIDTAEYKEIIFPKKSTYKTLFYLVGEEVISRYKKIVSTDMPIIDYILEDLEIVIESLYEYEYTTDEQCEAFCNGIKTAFTFKTNHYLFLSIEEVNKIKSLLKY